MIKFMITIIFVVMASTAYTNNVFIGYDRPIPMCRKTSALRDGSDHNKSIPRPEKKPWNGNE